MADFSFDRVLLIRGDINNGEFQWVNQPLDQPISGTVNDPTGPGLGVLDTGDSTTASSSFVDGDYTGHFITVTHDGVSYNFGIFETGLGSSSFDYCIPYNPGDLPFDLPSSVPSSFEDATVGFDETLSNAANCFLTGTRIATPSGPRAIQTLAPGDHVLTANGQARLVRWVWQQQITNIFGLGDTRAPVCVTAHALAPGCPDRDLILTADHALFVDGALINAGALVNDTTITRLPLSAMPATFTYWHVETDAHCVLMAENCPAESFIDYRGRDGFDNYGAYLAQGGKDRVISEMACPRVASSRLVPAALKRRLHPRRVA